MNNLRIMSFNIKVGGINDTRLRGVTDVIRRYYPDLLGIQEAHGRWMDHLTATLGDTYDYVYLGRDDPERGEGTPVFYRKDLFALLSSGTKWLTDTPDRYSVIEGSRYPRVMTYAELENRASGERLVFVSTHIDYSTDRVATEQCRIMHGICSELFGDDARIFITGDFNSPPEYESIKYMTGKFALSSSHSNDVISDPTPTNDEGTWIIDYCFYNPSYATPKAYKVLFDKFEGIYPSDHRPLCVDFYLK